MIEKLKENTKIKLISLLSAIVLWMYVMAIVDPQETKLFENIPVTITNLDELDANDFVIYPEVNLNTDIYVTGKLSVLKNISKDDITVYGTMTNLIEGNNGVFLKANISKGVTYELKPDTIVIPLEKIVEEKRSVDVVVTGKYKNNFDSVQLEEDSVKISGPRSLVKEVQKLQATLDVDENKDIYTTTLNLIPINDKGQKVEGVTMETSSVNATVSLLVEKNVPINPVFTESSESLSTYELSQNNITIKGKKDIVDNITSINTKAINLKDVNAGSSKDVQLDIPVGIKIDESVRITIKINEVKNLVTKLTYTNDEVEIRNNNNSIDVATLKIPNTIDIDVEHKENIPDLNKSDITLYIDLSDGNDSFTIKYESKYDFENVKINPDVVTVE
ncbi:hypothetical protein EAI30_12550 [Romboutsia ilealis]|uniref:YbbR-like protein n=1 Tax=Romboutsia faecis TaxID=2764597 RepID=A0ABR7JT02_9FIRM|nr:CdaR family protein [Romboutsia faecis]MBC5997746.1 hypothetical protein [Romboutsia faecis]MRN25446.1 hypothetical protein [Romboutsia ilealis]